MTVIHRLFWGYSRLTFSASWSAQGFVVLRKNKYLMQGILYSPSNYLSPTQLNRSALTTLSRILQTLPAQKKCLFFPPPLLAICLHSHSCGMKEITRCLKLQSIAVLEFKLVWLVWQGNTYFSSEITCIPCTRSEIAVQNVSQLNSRC